MRGIYILEMILDSGINIYIHLRDENGETALQRTWLPTMITSIYTVRRLLDARVRANQRGTELYYIVIGGNINIVAMLTFLEPIM